MKRPSEHKSTMSDFLHKSLDTFVVAFSCSAVQFIMPIFVLFIVSIMCINLKSIVVYAANNYLL